MVGTKRLLVSPEFSCFGSMVPSHHRLGSFQHVSLTGLGSKNIEVLHILGMKVSAIKGLLLFINLMGTVLEKATNRYRFSTLHG